MDNSKSHFRSLIENVLYFGEFNEMRKKWKAFISRLEDLAPNAYDRRDNVFCYMVSSTRSKKSFVKMAQGTRPILSKEIYDLMENFIDYMKNLPGQEGENYKVIYKDFKAPQLIKRLLMKRPLVFCNNDDYNVLRINQPKIQSGKVKWDKIAKNLDKYDENSPYLREYISYDEILLSALVSISTPTYFVSDGSVKKHDAISENPFLPKGILCGLVGARLRKKAYMEHRFVFPRDSEDDSFFSVHHTDAFWIGNVYPEAFPEGRIPTLEEIAEKMEIYDDIYEEQINVKYLKKRLSFSVIPLIEEGVARGIEYKNKVVVSVPPIGAGVWKGTVPEATICNLIVTAVLDYLDSTFDPKKLEYLCAIYLPVVDMKIYSCYSNKNQISSIEVNRKDSSIKIKFKGVTDKQLTIFNQFRYVAQLLPEEFKSCLIVAAYAWDGNSYPGNEYWIDYLTSFDPQAILCSNLGQFQNPEVNTKLADAHRIKTY
ncbi:CLUMA_CG009424, isoform A [Clunio marinus]|uniref:CLUMA_CG009424, isoform A n=1 Tax=Clunio marinus TaxID=568069 RepID=A0A1J1I6P9_9DIPT|nr:CLUMA_CG009424, isoform A [Clunio marinus]